MKLKDMLPYLVINILSFYLLPLLVKDTGSAMIVLLLVLPTIIAVTSSIYGYKSKKIDLIYNLLIAILFIPVIFIYMNSSALVYMIVYFIVSILFNFIGKTINKNKKRRNIIIIVSIFILLTILPLWISGIIPKQIAEIYSTRYLKKNFPKIQLEYVDIEWVPAFGDYIIKFKDESDKTYAFVIGPKYFPIYLGQGMHGFTEDYREKYSE